MLATDVQVRSPGDNDPLRFTLTCEAGMNDGSAFPFAMLGLALPGTDAVPVDGLHWVWHDRLWATAGAILIGAASGAGLALVKNWWSCTVAAWQRSALLIALTGYGPGQDQADAKPDSTITCRNRRTRAPSWPCWPRRRRRHGRNNVSLGSPGGRVLNVELL